MQKPTWVKVVGILGIIFGCTGVWGSLNTIIMPKILQFQRELFGAAMNQARHDPDFPEELMDIIRSMWDLPAWFEAWAVIFGLVGLLVCAFYLVAAIRLLQAKPSADKLMIRALGASILLALLQVITLIPMSTLFTVMFIVGCLFSIIIDVILLAVILTSDRRIFSPGAAISDTSQPAP